MDHWLHFLWRLAFSETSITIIRISKQTQRYKLTKRRRPIRNQKLFYSCTQHNTAVLSMSVGKQAVVILQVRLKQRHYAKPLQRFQKIHVDYNKTLWCDKKATKQLRGEFEVRRDCLIFVENTYGVIPDWRKSQQTAVRSLGKVTTEVPIFLAKPKPPFKF